MKNAGYHSFIMIFILLLSCNSNEKGDKQKRAISRDIISHKDVYWKDQVNGKLYLLPDSINEKPISFYLNNAGVAQIAKDFYINKFRPSDNDSTTLLLSYLSTNDSIVRPFYLWCLDFTITISDGALSEYPGEPAIQYATKFPKEFFEFMDQDSTRERYKRWVEIIAYSGLVNYNAEYEKIKTDVTGKLDANCILCNDSYKKRNEKFVDDIITAIKNLD